MLREIIDWSEAWALLIPLAFLSRGKIIPLWLKPIRIYVVAAFLINIAATLIQKYKVIWGFHPGDFFWSNNFLYNIHSIIRFLLFSWFFILLNQRFMHRVKWVLPYIFILFIFINFIVFENLFSRNMLSSRLLATEAALLLFYCLQYYIFLMIEDKSIPLKKQPGFWIVTGLSFYVATSFFIFLFYNYLIEQNIEFAVDIWDVHNIAYILLCISIAVTLKRLND